MDLYPVSYRLVSVRAVPLHLLWLSGKYQILGGGYVLGSWAILEPVCLKAAGRTEHLGAFPSVQKADSAQPET